MSVPREREGSDSTNVRSDKRLYEVWQGSNKFLCCGRLIFGPDVRSLYMTLVLILVPMASFCVFVGRHLMTGFSGHSGIAIMVVAVIHTCAVLTFLLLTSARDPGIIPRNNRPPEVEDGASSASEWTGGQTPKLPRTKDVIVNGISVKVKYCDTCMLYRPPRCSHCSICNNCVERFDHHCPWVGQCIGQRNYPSFFMFVLSATLLCMFIFSMCALRIKQLMDGDPPHTVWKALQRSPASAFLMAYTFLATWFVGGLTVFHLYLISTNQTTYENFRYRYDNKINAYDRGSCRNFDDVLCSGAPPSRVNFRARVQLEALGNSDYNTPSRQRESMDMLHPNRKKATPVSKAEIGRESAWTSIGISEDVQYRPTSGGGMSKEITKHGIREDMLFETIARPVNPPNDLRNTVVAHAHRNSNWEMSTEILGLSSPIGREGGTHNKVAYSVASYK